MDDEVLGAEPSANHVKAESARGSLRSSNTKTSVVGCTAVSSARPAPGRRKVSFAPAGGLPLVSDAIVVSLPPLVAALLVSSPDHNIPLSTTPSMLKKRFTVADTDATDHMFPERSAFISYHRSAKSWVRLGNNSFAPILGKGTIIIFLDGKVVMIRNALHVPGLHAPLYSLRAHAKQPGCGFIDDDDLGEVFVYFPTFCLQADTHRDCHLSYAPLGTSEFSKLYCIVLHWHKRSSG